MAICSTAVLGALAWSCLLAGGSANAQRSIGGHGGTHSTFGRIPFSARGLRQMTTGDAPPPPETAMSAGLGDEVQPAPPSIGSDVPVTYFGPPPSEVDRRLIGPFQLLKSGTVDQEARTVTMPIYKGIIDGGKQDDSEMFYVVTDTTDAGNAEALGINHSSKLHYGNTGRGARKAYLRSDTLVHFAAGTVDFAPEHQLKPGNSTPFPPSVAKPGSVGDEDYSPLFVLENGGGEVYNAPIVSAGATTQQLRKWCDGIPDDELADARKVVHDKVISICPDPSGRGGTVTLELTPGHSFARPVLYLSLDASDEAPAAIEAVTYAKALTDVRVGGDDSLFSAVERIFIQINGQTNEDLPARTNLTSHPSRQGLNSALMGEGAPLNVLGGIPTVATDYSPLWDANVGEWTKEAVDGNLRVRLLEEFQILGLVQRGLITGPGGVPYGSAGFIVNCPIVFRFL